MPQHGMQVVKDTQMSGSSSKLTKPQLLFVVLADCHIFVIEQHPCQQYRSVLRVLIKSDQFCVQ